jgi:hypothetical protein
MTNFWKKIIIIFIGSVLVFCIYKYSIMSENISSIFHDNIVSKNTNESKNLTKKLNDLFVKLENQCDFILENKSNLEKLEKDKQLVKNLKDLDIEYSNVKGENWSEFNTLKVPTDNLIKNFNNLILIFESSSNLSNQDRKNLYDSIENFKNEKSVLESY